MADVSFDEEPVAVPQPLSAQAPALVRLVMRWGFAKDQKGAEQFLLWTIGACVLLIVGVFFLTAQSVPEAETPRDPAWPGATR